MGGETTYQEETHVTPKDSLNQTNCLVLWFDPLNHDNLMANKEKKNYKTFKYLTKFF